MGILHHPNNNKQEHLLDALHCEVDVVTRTFQTFLFLFTSCDYISFIIECRQLNAAVCVYTYCLVLSFCFVSAVLLRSLSQEHQSHGEGTLLQPYPCEKVALKICK
ncbi:hypothetical protein FKM82_003104 [Ascaphus truei]